MKSTDSWHCYLAHGLRLRSAIELPLPPSAPLDSSRPPDVVIRYGDVPAALRQPIAKRRLTSVGRRGFWEATRSAFLMDVENAGRFHVEGGREVRLRPNASLDEVGQLLVRVLLPLLLQQRGLTTLHASAVATSAGAVLFLGPSGAGKSSLASALTELGHPLLGDDLMALEKTADGRTKVLPAAPQTKLRPDAAEHLGLHTKGRGKACAAGKFYFQSRPFPFDALASAHRLSAGDGTCANPQSPCRPPCTRSGQGVRHRTAVRSRRLPGAPPCTHTSESTWTEWAAGRGPPNISWKWRSGRPCIASPDQLGHWKSAGLRPQSPCIWPMRGLRKRLKEAQRR